MQPGKESKKTTYLVLGVLVLAIIFSIAISNSDSSEKSAKSVEIEEKKGLVAEVGPLDDSDQDKVTAPVNNIQNAEGVGSYKKYSATAIATSEADNIILFFHATWCPSCHALNDNIEENLLAIPTGVEIYKTDYDTETELKKKYGITTQHTLVLIKKDGTMIKKWSGSPTLSSVLSNL